MLQHHRQRLDRLAQTHVVGKAGPGAPVRQPGQPAEAFDLIVAKLGLKGRGHLRLVPARRPYLLDLLAPLLVGVELARPLQRLFHGGSGHPVDPAALAVAFGQRAETVELAAQLLGHRQEAAIVELDETALGAARALQQLAQVHHEVFVDPQLAADIEPVARRPQLDRHLFGGGHRRYPKASLFRPFQQDRAGIGLDLGQELQAVVKVRQLPFQIAQRPLAQGGAGGHQSRQFRLFAVKVAVGPLGLAVDQRQHRLAGMARQVMRPVLAERPDEGGNAQAAIDRDQTQHGRRTALDRRDIDGLDFRPDRQRSADGLTDQPDDAFAPVAGHDHAFRTQQRPHLDDIGRDLDHPVPVARFRLQEDGGRIGEMRQRDPVAAARFGNHQLDRVADQFQLPGAVIGVEDPGVPDQGEQRLVGIGAEDLGYVVGIQASLIAVMQASRPRAGRRRPSPAADRS